jgi:hypothetical protein
MSGIQVMRRGRSPTPVKVRIVPITITMGIELSHFILLLAAQRPPLGGGFSLPIY